MKRESDILTTIIGGVVVIVVVFLGTALINGVVLQQLFHWFVFPYTDAFDALAGGGWAVFVGLSMLGALLAGTTDIKKESSIKITGDNSVTLLTIGAILTALFKAAVVLFIGAVLAGFLPPVG